MLLPISFRGPKLYNKILNKEKKGLESHTLFKEGIKLKLLDMENEYSYFLYNKKPLHTFFI